MTIFSAVMSINDRPSCISYTGAALLGAGRRPWEISDLPGHVQNGAALPATLPPARWPFRKGLDFLLDGLAP